MVKLCAGAQLHPVVAAIGQLDEAVVVAIGPARVEPDGAADRILAGERALRPAQDLDPVEVDQLDHRAVHRREIDVVDIDADAGLEREGGVALADAADIGRDRRAEGRRRLAQGDVGRVDADVGEVGLAARFEHLAGDGGDRERRVLEVLLPELGGDVDGGLVLARAGLLTGLGRRLAGRRGFAALCRRRRGDRQARRQSAPGYAAQQAAETILPVHLHPPHLRASRGRLSAGLC